MKILRENKNDIAVVGDIKRFLHRISVVIPASSRHSRVGGNPIDRQRWYHQVRIFNWIPLFRGMTRTVRFTLLGAFFLIIGVAALTIYLQTNHQAEAAWYDTSWDFRQAVTVTVSSNSSDITNLETVLTINTSTLINAGKLQTSCQDLRFTSVGGKQLSYYIDSACNTTATKVWVAVDKVPANTTTYTLYMYYGNPNASAGSDSNRFDLFNGLVGYWPMNETSYNNVANEVKDDSVNGNNGTGAGYSTTSLPAGKYSNAGTFNGSTQYVTLGNVGLSGSNSFTIAAWIKPAGSCTTANPGTSFDFGANTLLGSVGIETCGGTTAKSNYISFGGYGYAFGTASNTLTPGVWNHVVITYSGGAVSTGAKIYINGIQQSITNDQTNDGTLNLSNTNYAIGRIARANANYFSGLIDDTRIYNRALSQTEINTLYRNPGTIENYSTTNSSPTITFAQEEKSTAPALYYKFDEGTGTITNNSGSGWTGTLTNGLVGYWKMDEATNSWNNTTGEVKDYSGSGNNGTGTGFSGTSSPSPGVYGNAGVFNGSNQSVVTSKSPTIGTGDFTMSIWVKSTSTTADKTLFIIGNQSTSLGSVYFYVHDTATIQFGAWASNAVPTVSTATAFNGKWHLLTGTKTGNVMTLYLDGVQQSQVTLAGINVSSASPFVQIGTYSTGSGYFNGSLDDARLYNRALSSTEVQSLYSYGITSSVGNLSGTTNPTWQTEDQCISGKCLYFNGVTSNVASIASVSAQTVSFWTKPASSSAALVGLSLGVDIYASSGIVGIDGITSPTIYVNGKQNGPFTANTWNQIEVTTATPFNANAITIGQMQRGILNGFMDEFKIYDYARTSTQVAADYNSRGTLNAGANVLGASANNQPSALSNGLMGYWKMDEASWNGTAGEVKDASGNSNNGTAQSSAAIGAGKFGNGGSFNGSTQYIAVANTISGVQSVAFWINPTSVTTGGIMQLTSSAYITLSSGTITATGFTSPTIYVNGAVSSTLSTGSWQHVVVTSSTGITSNAIQFAKANSIFTNGALDEVRVYNHVLSPTDIQTLYNYAPGPITYYNFNENAGSTVNDTSYHGNTGTWNGTLGNQWKPGKYGSAGNFNGTNNYVSATITGMTTAATGYNTVSFWMNWNGVANDVLFNIGAPYYSIFIPTTTCMGYNTGAGDAYGINPTGLANKWTYITFVFYNGAYTGHNAIYVNGVNQTLTQCGGSGSSATASTNLQLGDLAAAYYIGAKIDDFRIYNYAESQKQILQDMNQNQNESNVAVGGGSRSAPVGYWKFDEGFGTVANNSGNSGSGLNGTLTNIASPATSVSGWQANGKFGRDIAFDGSNDYITTGNPATAQLTGSLAITGWIYLSSNSTTQDILAKDGTSGQFGYKLYVTSAGKLAMDISSNGTAVTTATGTTTLAKNIWYHVTGVYLPNQSITVYVNGKQDGQNSASIPASIQNSTANLLIGAENAGATDNMQGQIDDLKLYGYSLSPQDILLDYNHNVNLQLGSLGTAPDGKTASNSASAQYCVPGDTSFCAAPVAEYNFEEGPGSTTVNDTSGNGDQGTWNGTGKQHYLPGNGIGWDGNLNGVDDYVSIPSLPSMNTVTVSAWIKTSQTGQIPQIVNRDIDGTHRVWQFHIETTGVFTFIPFNTSRTYGVATGTKIVTDNKWHYLVGTWDGTTVRTYVDGVADGTASLTGTLSTDVANVLIGQPTFYSGGNYFKGQIDQVRIYNYARTPSQILWDYNRGTPIAWWKMDECQGSVVNDSSGNGNVGTITIGAGGSQTAVGTCNDGNSAHAWNNGTVGKFNSSLNFDGVDDSVSVTNTLSGVQSVSFWAKPASSSASFLKLATNVDVKATGGTIGTDGFTSPTIYINGRAGTTMTANTWNHIVITTGTAITANAITLGKMQLGVLNGQLDDVRMYNYALTAYQVQTLYNGGAAVRFGPAVGAP